MASAPAPTHRASLLAGLRTGGVRSASMAGVPHTAAPGISFDLPSRFASAAYGQQFIGEEDDQLSDMLSHNMYINAEPRVYQPPNTAAVDGGVNRFALQQGHFTSGLSGIPHPNTAVGNAQLQVHAQQQALQMQLMQLELLRMQVRPPSPHHFSCNSPPFFRLCKHSSCKPSCWPRATSRAVADHSCLLPRPVPQHSHLI